MSKEKAIQAALKAASESKAKKRKVGCAILLSNGRIATGRNYHPDGLDCENSVGETVPEVIHAEIDAITSYVPRFAHSTTIEAVYVTHNPCQSCLEAIKKQLGDVKIIVVEEFMKFDTTKLRYDLIPTSSTKALAEVLTYGAKKYKPNNWKQGDLDRYTAAAMRHLEAWRGGEKLDEESGLKHLAHLMTNIAFMIELDSTN